MCTDVDDDIGPGRASSVDIRHPCSRMDDCDGYVECCDTGEGERACRDAAGGEESWLIDADVLGGLGLGR